MKSILQNWQLLYILSVPVSPLLGQQAAANLPKEISIKGNYLFYQHGAVVTVLGDNAVNNGAPEWGPYEYSKILDSLRVRGFHVISEIRKQGVAEKVYADKMAMQVDTLLKAGVAPERIVLVGASAGWEMVLMASSQLENDRLKFVMMGGCWPETYKTFTEMKLYGHFLSIIEESDPHGTCGKVFEGRSNLKSYQEIKLQTGLSHGFFYKGRKVWIDPLVEWFSSK